MTTTLEELTKLMEEYNAHVCRTAYPICVNGSECDAWAYYVRDCQRVCGDTPWEIPEVEAPEDFASYWTEVAEGRNPEWDADTGQEIEKAERQKRPWTLVPNNGVARVTYWFEGAENWDGQPSWLHFIGLVNRWGFDERTPMDAIFGEPTRLLGETWLGTHESGEEELDLDEGEVGREEYPEARLSIMVIKGVTWIRVSALTEWAAEAFRAARRQMAK